ncbi:hypothetical protein [Treponema sp. Marseille-Q4130]|uniref:hypothetical protein n=1 Tax=Treponema sp. Marseille-Q4130 TaxID=2766702 RepID=UPI00165216D6|nr:hypothetical protein [Treponema sp. Marseille-Q4130]MBC6720306.1 hypothetical protein [Treponema sp. Marseille-Q4130]
MSANSIGGFYVDLGLKADRDSFSKGKHSVEALTNSLSRFIGTVRNASAIVGAGIGTLTVASGKFESQQLLTAKAIGTTAKNVDKLRISAQIVGSDGKAFVSAVGALATKIQLLKDNGENLTVVSDQFAKLREEAKQTNIEFEKISFQDFLTMDPADRALMILRMGQAVKNPLTAATYVNGLLGNTGSDFLNRANEAGKSIESLWERAGTISLVDDESMRKAFGFSTHLSEFGEQIKSNLSLFGSELGGGLTPILERMNKYLSDHGPEIAQKITGIANSITKITTALEPIAGTAIKTAIALFGDLAETLASISEGDWEKVGENLKKFFGNVGDGLSEMIFGKGLKNETKGKFAEVDKRVQSGEITRGQGVVEKTRISGEAVAAHAVGAKTIEEGNRIIDASVEAIKMLQAETKNTKAPYWISGLGFTTIIRKEFSEFLPETQEMVNAAGGPGKFGSYIKPKWAIKDGVIRPNGQVTQVAPDDWVFAVRDIQDLGRAFLPNAVSYANASQYITINQTINITSPTDWMPQTIKQQAFNGARDGLLQAITEGNRRIQLMPGTR